MNSTFNPQLYTRIIFTLLSTASIHGAFAQALTEKTGIRFYEHHSSDMTGLPIGSGANGAQSGYDFVERKFFNSFDESTMGSYSNGEEANIDMVEHNGPFGTNGASMYLGFTSGVSTIWGGSIKGNGITKWMKAPANFDYAAAGTVSVLSDTYKETSAGLAVAAVKNGEIYIGKIRGTGLYVALKCYNVHIPTGSDNDNTYFEFDYKYGSLATGIEEATESTFSVYPNPAKDYISVNLTGAQQLQTAKICSLLGEELIRVNTISSTGRIDISTLPAGLYILTLSTTDGSVFSKPVIKRADQ